MSSLWSSKDDKRAVTVEVDYKAGPFETEGDWRIQVGGVNDWERLLESGQ